MTECSRDYCCRCEKGPRERWYGAIKLGSHILCVECVHSIEETLLCGESDD